MGPVPLGGGALGGAAPARLMMGRLVDADGRIVLSPSSTLGSLSIVPSPGDRLHTVRQQADATSMSQESAGQARPAPTNRGAMGGAARAAAGATASGAAETLAGTDASTEGDATGAGPVVGAQNVPPVYKQQHTDAGAGGDRLAPLVQGGRSSAATAQEPGPVRQHADTTSMSQESAEEARPAPSTCGALGGAASAAAGATASRAAEILTGTDAGTEGEIHKHQHNLGKAQECSAFSETLALKACKYRPTKEAILSARKTAAAGSRAAAARVIVPSAHWQQGDEVLSTFDRLFSDTETADISVGTPGIVIGRHDFNKRWGPAPHSAERDTVCVDFGTAKKPLLLNVNALRQIEPAEGADERRKMEQIRKTKRTKSKNAAKRRKRAALVASRATHTASHEAAPVPAATAEAGPVQVEAPAMANEASDGPVGSKRRFANDSKMQTQMGMPAWSTDDVCEWLVREGMECVAGAARGRRIDGRDLIHFDKECWSELGVSAALDRARLMARLQEASKETAAAEQAAAPRDRS